MQLPSRVIWAVSGAGSARSQPALRTAPLGCSIACIFVTSRQAAHIAACHIASPRAPSPPARGAARHGCPPPGTGARHGPPVVLTPPPPPRDMGRGAPRVGHAGWVLSPGPDGTGHVPGTARGPRAHLTLTAWPRCSAASPHCTCAW